MRPIRSRFGWLLLSSLLAAPGLLLLPGCKKAMTVTLTEWETYQDPYAKISFTYPKGWMVDSDGGKVSVYSSQKSIQKFLDPMAQGEDGAMLQLLHERIDSVRSLDAIVDAYRAELTASGFAVKSVAAATLDGAPAKAITFGGAYSKDTKVRTTRFYALKDTMLYSLIYSGYNEYFDACGAARDSMVASLRLPRPMSASQAANPALPSETFDTFDNYVLRVSYPDNFTTATVKPKGTVQFSLDIKGYRQDCNIRIDVLPAKNLTLDKVIEQNLKFYKPTSRGETKIDGQRAIYLNYRPAKEVESRAYFYVKGDKVVRSIFNAYAPMKADFVPVFEKTIGSLRLK